MRGEKQAPEVKEVIDVEVPWGCAVKVSTTFWPIENVVSNDIPRDDDDFYICDAIDTYKESSCNFRES